MYKQTITPQESNVTITWSTIHTNKFDSSFQFKYRWCFVIGSFKFCKSVIGEFKILKWHTQYNRYLLFLLNIEILKTRKNWQMKKLFFLVVSLYTLIYALTSNCSLSFKHCSNVKCPLPNNLHNQIWSRQWVQYMLVILFNPYFPLF